MLRPWVEADAEDRERARRLRRKPPSVTVKAPEWKTVTSSSSANDRVELSQALGSLAKAMSVDSASRASRIASAGDPVSEW